MTSYESGDLPNTTFSGGPICSPLYLLQLGPGCRLVTPLTAANYPNNTILVDFTTWASYCKYYSDVLELLPPVSPHWPGVSVVIFISPYVSELGTYSEPQGNLSMIQDYTVNGRYGLVLVGNTIGYQINATRNDLVCVVSQPSAWWQYFNSPGFIVYQVIMCLLYGGLFLLSLIHVGVAVKKGEILVLRTMVVFFTGVMGLCKSHPPYFIPQNTSNLTSLPPSPLLVRLLEMAIDNWNHLGRLNVVAWGFLSVGSQVLMLIVCCFLVTAWAGVVKKDINHSRLRKLGIMIKYAVYTLVPVAVLYLIVTLLHWGIPSIPFIIEAVFLAIILICLVIVIVSFLVLGGRILQLVNSFSLTGNSVVIFKVTLITMSCVTSMVIFIAYLVVRIVAIEGIVISFQVNLGSDIIADLFLTIIGYGVILAFSISSLKELKSSSHTGVSVDPVNKQALRGTASDLYKMDHGTGRQLSANLDRADDLVTDLQPRPAEQVSAPEGDQNA